jgi:hypothetical protein
LGLGHRVRVRVIGLGLGLGLGLGFGSRLVLRLGLARRLSRVSWELGAGSWELGERCRPVLGRPVHGERIGLGLGISYPRLGISYPRLG